MRQWLVVFVDSRGATMVGGLVGNAEQIKRWKAEMPPSMVVTVSSVFACVNIGCAGQMDVADVLISIHIHIQKYTNSFSTWRRRRRPSS